jgi:cytidine deaminase
VSVDRQWDALIAAACEARLRAYAPYSKFLVGAALATLERRIFTGCNVENASYGLTICAERTAVFNAVAAGERRFSCFVVATSGGLAPCGACRQVLIEFCDDLPVLLVDVDGGHPPQELRLRDLLPGPFQLGQQPPPSHVHDLPQA